MVCQATWPVVSGDHISLPELMSGHKYVDIITPLAAVFLEVRLAYKLNQGFPESNFVKKWP